MNVYNRIIWLALLIAFSTVCGCDFMPGNIYLVDAKIVTAVDEKLMPIKATDVFPKGTSTVSCWIEWKNASINTEITARWHYVTDDIYIVEYKLVIPKKDGVGSIVLTMPNGKELPAGKYKAELFCGGRLLRSLTFTVE